MCGGAPPPSPLLLPSSRARTKRATVAEQVRQRVQISIHPWRPREERKPTLLLPAECAVAGTARSCLLLPSLDRDRPFLVPAPRGHEGWLSSQERRRWPAAAPSSSLPPSTCSVQMCRKKRTIGLYRKNEILLFAARAHCSWIQSSIFREGLK